MSTFKVLSKAAIALSTFLLFEGCGGSSGGNAPSGFFFTGTNLIPGGIWPINRPIELVFNKGIDLATIDLGSISIVAAPPASIGAPAAGPVQGDFFLRSGEDEHTLVFQPLCPSDEKSENGGLVPGNAFGPVIYFLSIQSDTTTRAIRSQDGSRLQNTFSISFQTPQPPLSPFLDPKPASPPGLLGKSSLPAQLPLNLLIDPIAPILFTLDQPLFAPSVKEDSIRIEFFHPVTGETERVPSKSFLIQNCGFSQQSMLSVLPLGVLPPEQNLRFILSREVRGLGDQDHPLEELLLGQAFVSNSFKPRQLDILLESFSSTASSDPAPPRAIPLARWDQGLLQAAPVAPAALNHLKIEIGPRTLNGSNILFSTDGAYLKSQDGIPVFFPDGVIECEKFTIRSPLPEKKSSFVASGSRPLMIRVNGDFTIEEGALLSVQGQTGLDVGGVRTADIPVPGGEGRCGGGDGGWGSPSTTGSDIKGNDGNGAFNTVQQGGKGGHSGYGTADYPGQSRAGGGGGGNWGVWDRDASGAKVAFCYSKTPCTVPGCPLPLTECPDATCTRTPPIKACCEGVIPNPTTRGEDGATGVDSSKDVFTGIPPAMGGKAGNPVFVDGDDENNFFGRKIVGFSVVEGELPAPLGGQGGGGGGDAVPSVTFPNLKDFKTLDIRGGGGGGGGGIVYVEAMGTITIRGQISADGGDGGNGELIDIDTGYGGGGGGGGAGGMILLESCTQVRIGANALITSRGGNRSLGAGVIPSSYPQLFGGLGCRTNITASHGGAGGKGVAEVFLPADQSALVSCGGLSQPAVKDGALIVELPSGAKVISCERDPDLSSRFDPAPHLLIPTLGPRSASRSNWYYLGQASLFNPARFEFDGIDADGLVDSASTQTLASGTSESVSISGHSVVINDSALAELIRSEPQTLIADAFQPDAGSALFTIQNAFLSGNTLTLSTDPEQGKIPAAGQWKLLRRFFQTTVNGQDSAWPSSAHARMAFEGAQETFPGSMLPDSSTLVGPTTRVSDLDGLPLIRFTVEFDMNVSGQTLTTNTVVPGLRFVKIPYRF